MSLNTSRLDLNLLRSGSISTRLTERFLDAPWLLLLVIFFVSIINLIIVSVRKANQINSLSLSLHWLFCLFCFICHIYPPFTRKRIVSLYFGREVRTRLGVAFFEVYGPPVFHIKVGRPVKCLAQHNKRTCRLVLHNLP